MVNSIFLRLQKTVVITLCLLFVSLIGLGVIRANPSSSVSAQSEATRVLVIANRNSPVSLRVAQYYMQRRGIPTTHCLTLDLPDSSLIPLFESISYPTYQSQIEQPLQSFLNRNHLSDRIRYIVLTKGVPFRVEGVPHLLADGQLLTQNQSVDSTIAALDYKTAAIEFRDSTTPSKELLGMVVPNLYWRQTDLFEHRLTGGYLVTRLDGYTEADTRSLIDRALTPRHVLVGNVLIDPTAKNESSHETQLIDIFDPKSCTPSVISQCSPQSRAMNLSIEDYNNDLRLSQELVEGAFPNLHVEIAPPKTFVSGQSLIAYASWGSNDPSFRSESYQNLQFLPGAIADTAVSTSGRTFFPNRNGQSQIGDLIARSQGVAGVRGYTDEPQLEAVGSPSVLFSNYLRGANLASAYYRSIRFVGWRDLVLGDPLTTAVFDR